MVATSNSVSSPAGAGQGPVKSLYNKYETLREPYLRRARESARYTIPTLIPPTDTAGPHTRYITPYQGIGARGVNNLASKLLLALLPPNSPFFKYTVDDFTLEQMTQKEGMRAEVEEAFNKVERAIMTELEVNAARVSSFEALKHLLVAGNCLLYIPPDNKVRVFPLHRYAVKRDPMGNVLEIITKEIASPRTIPDDILFYTGINTEFNDKSVEDNVEIYTYIRRDPERPTERWLIHQEMNGWQIPKTDGWYPITKSPWLPLRYSKIDNEDYGRGFIEEYIGDLKSLEALTMAIVQGSAAAAKVLFLVDPNGVTDAKDLDEAPSGAIREGRADEVSVLQLDKYNDFRVALETIKEISQRLAFAFMLNTSIQRKGERVTAEEIRFMAGELEDALGGVYSILSQEFQLPLVLTTADNMQRKGRLPALPEGIVRPQITTGLEALGRGHDLNKLAVFMQHLAPLGGEVLNLWINLGDLIKRTGTSLGIDMKGLVNTKEEVAMKMQQMQLQALAEKMGPNFMKMLQSMTEQGGTPSTENQGG